MSGFVLIPFDVRYKKKKKTIISNRDHEHDEWEWDGEKKAHNNSKIDYLICYKTDDTYESIERPETSLVFSSSN